MLSIVASYNKQFQLWKKVNCTKPVLTNNVTKGMAVFEKYKHISIFCNHAG